MLCAHLGGRRASLVAQTVKTLPAMQGTWVRSLGPEDPLEKGMAESDMTQQLTLSFSIFIS